MNRFSTALARQPEGDAQPSIEQVTQAQLAAMAMCKVACDAESHAVALLLAGQTEMRLEHLLELLLGHARPLVIDMQDERLGVVLDVQACALAVLQGVVQQVADTAACRDTDHALRRRG